jgi:SAM-dependent methyltransferase
MIPRLSAILMRKIDARATHRGGSYTREFFVEQDIIARRSAEVVVPLVLELVKPRSVVDVGCGAGSWLAAFATHGIEDVLGVESEAVPSDVLRVPASAVIRRDLTHPLTLDRTFDLVVSLEVAEHLPPNAAEDFISALAALGQLVLFSAAIPHQGGRRHVNERWPDYWAGLFARRGYVAIDCLRRKVWADPAVAWWYAQNMLLFANERALQDWPILRAELEQMGTSQLSLVHPRCYQSWRRALRQILRVRALL